MKQSQLFINWPMPKTQCNAMPCNTPNRRKQNAQNARSNATRSKHQTWSVSIPFLPKNPVSELLVSWPSSDHQKPPAFLLKASSSSPLLLLITSSHSFCIFRFNPSSVVSSIPMPMLARVGVSHSLMPMNLPNRLRLTSISTSLPSHDGTCLGY